ncbi:hypothetical protein OH491_03165 [Termitidicoccus mucosus]|uniref:hypothetical protein n=1 Tax=Termitidicoccus mucosus TaxID=1184151 RepID=UPI003182F169
MNLLKIITDPYDRKARLWPALLLVFPVVITIITLLSEKLGLLQQFLAIIIGCGGAFLCTQFARDSGKRKESKLFKKWGGMPSVAILRHSDNQLNPITKLNYHKRLACMVENTCAPTSEQEADNKTEADKIYEAWSNYLRAMTRDTQKYALLFHENISYGFRRNIRGLRSYGISVSVICIILCGLAFWHTYEATGEIETTRLVSVSISAIFLFLWSFVFTDSWVLIPAQAYAERLMESIETIANDTK